MTVQADSMLIKPEWLDGLGASVKSQSPVSPLGNYGEASLSPDQVKELQKSGILQQDGSLSSSAGGTFQSVASATSITRLRLISDNSQLEYSVYFNEGQPAVSLINTVSGLVIDSPPVTDGIIETVSQYSGLSQLGYLDLDDELSYLEAQCLMAMIDLARKDVFKAYSEGNEIKSKHRAVEDVMSYLQHTDLDANSLLWLLQALMPEDVAAFDDAAVTKTLESLAERKFLDKHTDGYETVNYASLIAIRLMMVQSLYRVDMNVVNSSGDGMQLRFGVIQNGVRDLLYLEATEGSVRIVGYTSEGLLGLLTEVFNKPPEIPEQSESSGATTLEFVSGPLKGQVIELGVDTLSLGRSKTNTVALKDKAASGKHAEIRPAQDGWVVVDLGSSNGTLVNDRELSANEPCPIKAKDVIKLGTSVINVVADGNVPGSGSQDDEDEDRTMIISSSNANNTPDVAAQTQPAGQAAPATPQTTACPSCGAVVKAGAKFCGGCGATIGVAPVTPSPSAATCSACGAELKPGAQFCGGCGAKL